MRRKDREITDPSQIRRIMQACTHLNLALCDGDTPYIIPMNFGFEEEDGKWTIYFHSAGIGTKIDLLRKNPQAAFAMTATTRLIEGDLACDYSMAYESVCGKGRIEIVPDGEKIRGLTAVMRQYSAAESFVFDETVVRVTTVLRLSVDAITGKSLDR